MQHDIGRIMTILGKVESIETINGSITNGLATLEGNTSAAVSPDNAAMLSATIERFNRSFQGDMENTHAAYKRKWKNMLTTLSAMRAEDAAAHRKSK